MNEQCKFCIHSDVCAYKEHYEDAVKLYEKAKNECGKYPWFKCEIVCVKYRKAESEDKCKKCEYSLNPDYTRCHDCKAESEGAE